MITSNDIDTYRPPRKPSPPALSRDTTNTIDELEDLLNGLDDTSSRSSVRTPGTTSKPAANPRLSAAPPRAAAPAAPHTPASGSGTFGINTHATAAPSHHHNPTHHAGAPTHSFSAHAHTTPANSNSSLSFGVGANSHPSTHGNSSLSFGVSIDMS